MMGFIVSVSRGGLIAPGLDDLKLDHKRWHFQREILSPFEAVRVEAAIRSCYVNLREKTGKRQHAPAKENNRANLE